MTRRIFSFLVLLLLLPVVAVQAQDARGTIVGRVTDASGATIPNADVRATNAATGVVAAAKTNDSGNYALPYLAPGMYTVSSELSGFKKFVREKVQIRVNDTVELNVAMEVGNVSESVEVTAQTPLLNTAEASLGQVVDERRIADLPLFAGNAMDLVHLAPGTINGTDMRLRKAPFNNAPSQFGTDGTGNYGNEFTIDGVSNTYSDGTSPRVAFSPPVASLSEFKVQTSSFDASVGHTFGALVNVSTKGGTNDLHGEVWEVFRHSKLDAPSVFQNRSGQKLPIYQDNRYGFAAGAPIVIPKVYNGKNKTFFFFTYEANKFGDPNVGASTSTVPREAWRNGDLSDLLLRGKNYQVYDPGTIAVAPGGGFSRQPFAGNIIPANRIDPVAKNILKLYPMPNVVDDPTKGDGRNNYFLSGKALEDYWTTIGRVDHAFSEQNRMFVRFHRDYWQEDKNRSFGNDVNGIILNRINRGIAFDDVHVFSPGFLLNIRYGLTQQEFPERRVSSGFDLASLGFSSGLTNLVDNSLATIPRIAVGSLTQLSNWEGGDGTTASLTHSVIGNFTWLKGNHNIRFGPEMRVYREFRNRYPAGVSPDLSFSNAWGKGPLDTSTAPPVGGELVSLLLGIPGGSMTMSGSYAEQDKYFGFYIQDDFKVSRKLTLNIGLRAEHESPITERYNRSTTQFDATASNPIEAAAIANYAKKPMPELAVANFKVRGGMLFAGAGGRDREYWKSTFLNWLPRFGFAYQALPKTVIRGGYGIFFASIGVNNTNSNLEGFSRTTNITASDDNGLHFITGLANPLPTGLLQPLGAAGGLETTLSRGTSFFPENRKQPYSQRWSFGIQQEFKLGFVIESSYVGSRSTRLGATRNLSFTPAEYLSTTPYRDEATIKYLAATFTNPYYGLNPQFTGKTISRGSLLQQYPHFSNVQYSDPIGNSWYHSLQNRLEKRMAQGFTLQWSYTWSKAMQATEFLNASDPSPYRSLSGDDRPHRMTGSGIWDLPFGKGRRFGAKLHPVLEFMAGGWSLNGVYQHQSGSPLGFGQALYDGDPSTIVLSSPNRGAARWFNTDPFVTNSAVQLGSNIRTAPLRYSNIRTDSQRRWDFGLVKTFRITERVAFKFRADTYNALNEVVLRGPQTDPYNSKFGEVTAQEPPRSWQFQGRVIF